MTWHIHTHFWWSFLSKLVSSSTVPLQMLPVCDPCRSLSVQNLGNWRLMPGSSVLLFAQKLLFIRRAQNPILQRWRHCLSVRHKHTLTQHFTVLDGNNVVSWAAVLNVGECAPAFLNISQMQSDHSKLSFAPWLLNSQASEPEQDWTGG